MTFLDTLIIAVRKEVIYCKAKKRVIILSS